MQCVSPDTTSLTCAYRYSDSLGMKEVTGRESDAKGQPSRARFMVNASLS
jgi:hypothetical protein